MPQSLGHTLVKDCMTATLIAVSPYDTLARTYELIIAHEVAQLVVTTIMRLKPVCNFDNDTVGYAAELMLDNEIGACRSPIANSVWSAC